MDVIRGVRLLDFEVFNDGRGDLVAFEPPTNLPFQLRRIFYMNVDSLGIGRANHASSSHLLITAVSGTVTIDVDNGDEEGSLPLGSRARGVWTRPGIVVNLRNFRSDTLLLVCASDHFRDTRYFRSPQPDLIGLPAMV